MIKFRTNISSVIAIVSIFQICSITANPCDNSKSTWKNNNDLYKCLSSSLLSSTRTIYPYNTSGIPKVTRFADKILQRSGNQVSVPAVIQASSHVYLRTINLFQDICWEFFSNNLWLKKLSTWLQYWMR